MDELEKNGLTEDSRLSLKHVFDKWAEDGYSEDMVVEEDWRSKARAQMRAGDVQGIRRVVLPSVQYEVVKLAHTAKSEQVRLQAAMGLLAQEGQGAVQRIEQVNVYEQMPADELAALVMSKVQKLADVIPNFSIDRLVQLNAGHRDDVINVEIEEEVSK